MDTCHLSTIIDQDGDPQIKELDPLLSEGQTCLEDAHCESGWCDKWKCMKLYDYLEPNPGLCASTRECKSGLICDSRCIFKNRSRKKDETCNKHIQCKADKNGNYYDMIEENIGEAVKEGRKSDYIILCLGENTYTEKPGDLNDLNIHLLSRHHK